MLLFSFQLASTDEVGEKGSARLLLFNNLYLFLTVLHLCCCMGFSLVVASEGYSPVAVCGLLVVVASLVEEHGHYHV